MKTLLLCGYRKGDNGEILGLDRDANGMTRIERRIRQLRRQGQSVICVLSGQMADEQLRACRAISNCSLVFDTNEEACTLISNVRSGVFDLDDEPCFILPVEVPVPDEQVWAFLTNELDKVGYGTNASILQAVDEQGAPWQFGFPLVISRAGAKILRETPNIASLVDPRLKYLLLKFQNNERGLEQAAKPL